jgi:hypothetical protein
MELEASKKTSDEKSAYGLKDQIMKNREKSDDLVRKEQNLEQVAWTDGRSC